MLNVKASIARLGGCTLMPGWDSGRAELPTDPLRIWTLQPDRSQPRQGAEPRVTSATNLRIPMIADRRSDRSRPAILIQGGQGFQLSRPRSSSTRLFGNPSVRAGN